MATEQPAFQEIIASLEKGTPEEFEDAVGELYERGEEGLTVEEGIIVLKAATKEFALRKHNFEELSIHLVRAASIHSRMEYVPIITELYPKYDSKAKKEVLKLLATLEDKEAAVAYMNIVQNHARGGGVPALPELQQGCSDVFFPALLDYADIQALEWDIYVLLLSYFQRSLLSPEALGSGIDKILDRYRIYKGKLMSAQQKESVAWMWEEEYQ